MLLVNTIVLKVEILQSYSAMKHLILSPTEPDLSHLPVMSRTLNLAHSTTKHTHTKRPARTVWYLSFHLSDL